MEAIWAQDSPHANFLKQLYWDRATMFLADQNYLASLRHNHEMYHRDVKLLGHVFEMMGVDYFQEIYKASERKKPRPISEQTIAKPRPFPKPQSLTVDDILIRRAANWLPPEIVETILLFTSKDWNDRPQRIEPETPSEYDENGHYGSYGTHSAELPSVKII